MGQHPNPDPDEDDLEALGTPFYQGNGLSVRALTAEELQQFLDAHANQPTEPLGSGWAALDRPGHPLTVSRIPPGAEPASPQPQPVLPAQHAAGTPAPRGSVPPPGAGPARSSGALRAGRAG